MNKAPWRPGYGPDSYKEEFGAVEGHVYFATDTKKIYFSDGSNFESMGGNSSIYYGILTIPEDTDDAQTDFDFLPDDIEGEQLPNIDDLILNNDGCFFRVVGSRDDGNGIIIEAKRLTVAGSGGGGGGGSSQPTGVLTFDRVDPINATATVLSGKEFRITFNLKATDASGELTGGTGTYDVFIGGQKRISAATARQGENITDDISKWLNIGSNTVRITAKMDTGGEFFVSQSKTWTVNTTEMILKWDYDETIVNKVEDDSFTFRWSVSGQGIEKQTYIIIDDIYTLMPPKTTSVYDQAYTIRWSEQGLNYHTAHKVDMYATTVLNDITVETEHTYKNVILAEAGNTNPIIVSGLFDYKATQYNTVQIPIMIYSEGNAIGNASVTLVENSVVKDKWDNVANLVWNNWNYTPTQAGTAVLTIQCGNSELTIPLEVEALDIDNEEVGGYAFRFKASEFASNNAIQNWSSNGVTANFIDFDWINGGIKSETDENGFSRQYVCVPAGSQMKINYKLFEKEVTNGKSFKIIFKTINCRKFDAKVLNCGEPDRVNFDFNAQSATFSYGKSNINIPYCEDKYIELELDLSSKSDKYQYITQWLKGVPSGIVRFEKTDSFVQNNPDVITIGSDECDVYIYLIKFYEKHLTDEQHLQNFIADAPNAEEMLARYKRNNILDERGEISYSKLAEVSPDLFVHCYEVSSVPIGKDKGNPLHRVPDCLYAQYKGDGKTARITASGVEMRAQGTSSMAYGLAAFNLDSNFKNGFEDNISEQHLDAWAMDDKAIPVDYLNTKVNVASSEGANNALNQEWYNIYQPYIAGARAKERADGKLHRDTMQFYPGVVFIKDNNKVTNANNVQDNVFKDTAGYINNPYYKMYSIGCMGNSKKNVEVFHDLDNPLECCIEVNGNHLPGHQMIVPQGYDSANKIAVNIEELNDSTYDTWVAGMDEVYGFRYPDGLEEVQKLGENGETMIRGWFDFVKWCSENDPSPKYQKVEILDLDTFNSYKQDLYKIENNIHVLATSYLANVDYYIMTEHIHGYTDEPLASPVTYGSHTFRDNEYTKTLGAKTISKYAGTYDTDCYEYRMAKLLNECEDHLVMDSVLYHYLFIERHTMIDNVAKNTFWSTQDCVHWDLTKNYDNDTADGINNDGKLKYDYGYEIRDKDNTGNEVFNAAGSVWLNFIKGIPEACEEVYNNVPSDCWDSTKYLEAFTNWQEKIPERVWIEDYYRKYRRPYEVYGDSSFFERLEGGKREYQREQYEKYQNYYIKSLYATGDSLTKADSIMFRANGNLNFELPVNLYAKSYLRYMIDNNDGPKIKVDDNNFATIPFKGDYKDTYVYLQLPQLCSAVGTEENTLQNLNSKLFSTTNAKKLTKIALGSYQDKDRLNPIDLDQEISLASAAMLEEAYLNNYQATSPKSLNLSDNKSLRILDARNSNFTNITIADGAAIEKIYLEVPITITLKNLVNLEEFSINDYNNLETIIIDNIDGGPLANVSYNIVKAALEHDNFKRYSLYNVNWEIDETDAIIETSIPLLDNLQIKSPNQAGYGHADSLTGKMLFTEAAYSGANSLEIYDKYSKVYPNLDINFEAQNSKLLTINILNGNNDVCWTRKLRSGSSLDEVFLSDGPNGTFNVEEAILKASTAQHDYMFLEEWKVYDSDTNEELVNYKVTNNEYGPTIPNIQHNITIVPQFSETIRNYDITFHNIVNDTQEVVNAPFGSLLADIIPNTMPYKDDSNLSLEQTYKFIGWATSSSNANAGIVLNNIEAIKIQSAGNYYAAFEPASVYDNIVDFNYLTFTLNNAGTGYSIKAKSDVNLRGKITLPIVYNEKPIVAINNSGFQGQSNITHIFWEKGEIRVDTIGADAFGGTNIETKMQLQYFEMPDSIKTIEARGFGYCTKLNNFGKTLSSLEYLGVHAFIECDTITNLSFGEKLATISSYAFLAMNNLQIVQFGSQGYPSQLNEIGEQIFYLCPKLSNVTIYSDDITNAKWNLLLDSAMTNNNESNSVTAQVIQA